MFLVVSHSNVTSNMKTPHILLPDVLLLPDVFCKSPVVIYPVDYEFLSLSINP